MGYEYAKPGIGNVGSYQISGIPFVSGNISVPGNLSGALVINFPSVTQRIFIHNNDSSTNLRVGFSAAGVSGTNYFLLDAHGPPSAGAQAPIDMKIRVDKVYLLSNTASPVSGATIFAELTGIKPEFDLVASYSGAVGIG